MFLLASWATVTMAALFSFTRAPLGEGDGVVMLVVLGLLLSEWSSLLGVLLSEVDSLLGVSLLARTMVAESELSRDSSVAML